MRTMVVIVLFNLFGVVAPAQQTTTRKFHDEESTTILKELQKKIFLYKDISIQFTLRSEKGEKFIDEVKGTTLIKDSKYVLKTNQQEIFYNGITLWNYLPEQKEVTVSKGDNEDDSEIINPLKIIQNYEKSYKSNFIKETIEKGTLIQIIDLTPLKSSIYYKVRLTLDKNKKQIMRLVIYEKTGTQYTYTVNKFAVNQNISDEYFVFDVGKHSEVEVIDMR